MVQAIRARFLVLFLSRFPSVSIFVKYAIIGVGNVALDFVIYATLTRVWEFWRAHYLLANAFSFAIVVTWSFYWNKRWAFRNPERRHRMQYLKFVLVTLGGISIAQGVLYAGVSRIGLLDLVAKCFAAPLVVFWNFTMYRLWAFKVPAARAAPHTEVQGAEI